MATTRKIDGQHLSVDCFAYAPDPSDARTWRCCIRFPSDARRQINHIKNSLFRFSDTKGIPEEAKHSTWLRICGAAASNGITVTQREPQKAQLDLGEFLAERFLERLGY